MKWADFLGRIEPAELDVAKDRVVKKESLLRNEADQVTERCLADRAQVAPIESPRRGSRRWAVADPALTPHLATLFAKFDHGTVRSRTSFRPDRGPD